METRVLKNDLRVATIVNPSSEVVNLQIWIRCGSVYENESEQGLSHFIEHLVFKGTRNHEMGELAHAVESLGGDLNAFTSMEQTCFYISSPSLYVRESLSSLCDLVFYPLFDAQEVDNEREVILEEIKRSRDLPDRVMMTNFFNIHFKDHPYEKPVLGDENVIRNISRDAIISYYKRYYKPSNALLVICGNVDKKEVEDIVDELFSDIKNPDKDIKNADIPAAVLDKQFRAKIQQMDIREANLVMGFPVPGLINRDVPALDVLALILGQGESSRLVKSIRLAKGLVTSIYTSAYTPVCGGAFFIGFGIDATGSVFNSRLQEVIDNILHEVNTLRDGDFSQYEIDKAKTILLSERIFERETVDGFGKKIGSLISMTGGVEFEDQYFDWLKKVSKQDILDVINKYIISGKASVSAVIPNDTSLDESYLFSEISKMENIREQKENKKIKEEHDQYMEIMDRMVSSLTYNFDHDFEMRQPEIINDKSGARIILRRMNSTPLVSIRMLFPGGTRFENEANQGLSNLFARTWLYGCADLSYGQMADFIDGTASTMEAFSGRNSIGLSFDILKSFLPDMLNLGSKIITAPRFDEEFFNTEKMVIKDEIKSLEDNLIYYSGLLLLKTVYQNHPYRFEVQGTLDSLERLTRNDVLEFYRKYVVSNRMVVAVTGDFEKEEIVNWVSGLIKSMNSNREKLPQIPEEPEQASPRQTKFYKDSNQAHIALAYSVCDIKSDDRYVLRLISALLSGQSGRLFINLRDKKSLAYTVTPVMMFGPDPGYFGVYIACDPAKTSQALSGIRKEFSELINNSVDEDELLRAKNYILGRHVLSMQRFGEQGVTMAFDELYGLGYEAMLNFSKKILGIKSSDISRVAQKYYGGQRENTVIVSKKR